VRHEQAGSRIVLELKSKKRKNNLPQMDVDGRRLMAAKRHKKCKKEHKESIVSYTIKKISKRLTSET